MTAFGVARGMVLAAFLTALLAAPAYAAVSSSKERTLGTFGAWHSYVYKEGGQTVCYMVTTKLTKSTAPKKRATPYLMITHRPVEASTDVVSYGAGMRINERRGVKLHIGNTVFDLFSVRDTAWARDTRTDHKIAAAIRNAPMAQLSGFPDKKGAKGITDQFDLSGAAAAYHAIGKACGLPDETPKKPPLSKPYRHKHS